MKLKNILIAVSDLECSKAFYKELFGLDVITDLGDNVILTEGLVLQERKVWENCLEKSAAFGGHDAELYFEETQMEDFLDKLAHTKHSIEYVTPLTVLESGQRVVRIYDPDRHMIEVREPWFALVHRGRNGF